MKSAINVMDAHYQVALVWTCERERKTLHERTNNRLTNTQFEAEAGRRAELPKTSETASFRKLIEGTMRHLDEKGIATLTADFEKACAEYSDEDLALCLIATLLEVTVSQEEKLGLAGETMELAGRTLMLTLEHARGEKIEEIDEDLGKNLEMMARIKEKWSACDPSAESRRALKKAA